MNAGVDMSRYGRWQISVWVLCVLIATQIATVQGQYGVAAGAWKIAYVDGATVQRVDVAKHTHQLNLLIYDVDLSTELDFHFEVHIDEARLATVDTRIDKSEFSGTTPAAWVGLVPVHARHYGYTYLFVTLVTSAGQVEHSPQVLAVVLARNNRADDTTYRYIASALVLLMFVNLGTVLDLQRLKAIVLRPIGPAIGFGTSYLLMPALAIGLGYLCLRGRRELQLALFYTALAPSGGLASICNVFLRGNVNLSIASTTINSLLALGMFPLWIFLLARVIYDDESLSVPFVDLAVSSVALILAISAGLALRLLIPKTTRYIFKYLKPLSVFLSLCLIGVTVGINALAFKELTLMVCLATFLLPFVGYLLSFALSKLLRRSNTDSLTIGIETSVLNMTVPIVLLQYSLDDARVDMAVVVPMMAALLSLALVLIFYIVRRVLGWNVNADPEAYDSQLFLVEN